MQIKKNIIEHLCWISVLVILFFQSVLHNYSVISNIAMMVVAIRESIRLKIRSKGALSFVIVWAFLLIGYSVLLGNEVPLAIRFGLIFFLVIFAYHWETDYRFLLKLLFIISCILVISLICLEMFLFTISDAEYLALRNEFFIANNMGDVFWYNIYYKLELRGTPLVVFVYMLSYVSDVFPRRHVYFFRILYFVGVIFAGNFAYQMALFIFHVAYFVLSSLNNPMRLVRRIIWLSLITLVVGGYMYSYLSSEIKNKADYSNATRIDQANVLWEDLSQGPLTLFWGTGLGHTIEKKTQYRDYRGDTYFELQTLYIFNQLGLINFTLFVFVNIIFAIRFIRIPKLLLVYGVYVVYAFFNPYIWDTNHIVVITSLLCAKNQIMNNLLNEKRKNNLHFSALQPVS